MEDVSRVLQPDFRVERQGLGTGTGPGGASPSAPCDLPKAAPAAAREVEIVLGARVFLIGALGCIAVLVMLALLAAYLAYVPEAGDPRLISRAFLLDEEANIPTFFSFSLLLSCTFLLALIGARAFFARQPFRFNWALLAVLFLVIAFDEAAMVHERVGWRMREALGTSGFLYFAWIIPAGGLVAVLAVLYVPFLRGLPAPIARLFVLAGALYVGGSLGVEMPGGAYYEAHGNRTIGYQLITTAEETLEMLGLTVFAYALMRFLARQDGIVRLGFRAR